MSRNGTRLFSTVTINSHRSRRCRTTAPALGQSAVLPPLTVKAAKRLADDLRVLTMLTALEVPPIRRLRGSSKLKVLYGFGDSLGNGFGWSKDFGEEIR
jgi:hypothetical protein